MIDVDQLLHHVGHMPPVFLEEPRIADAGTVDVSAVLGDVFAAIGAPPPDRDGYGYDPDDAKQRNRQRVLLIAAWIAWAVRADIDDARRLQALFRTELVQLAALVDADQFAKDPDRQEELVRTVLNVLQLQPTGETRSQTTDRLDSLSTVQRTKILKAHQKKLERARELEAELKRKQREAQSSRYGRE